MNLNLYIGLAAVVGIGVLVKQGLLGDDWAYMAVSFVLGGAASYGGKQLPMGRKPKDDPEEPSEIGG